MIVLQISLGVNKDVLRFVRFLIKIGNLLLLFESAKQLVSTQKAGKQLYIIFLDIIGVDKKLI
eukprot:403343464